MTTLRTLHYRTVTTPNKYVFSENGDSSYILILVSQLLSLQLARQRKTTTRIRHWHGYNNDETDKNVAPTSTSGLLDRAQVNGIDIRLVMEHVNGRWALKQSVFGLHQRRSENRKNLIQTYLNKEEKWRSEYTHWPSCVLRIAKNLIFFSFR